MRILVGDIGGTHTRLSLAEVTEQGVRLDHTGRYLNAGVAHLAEHLHNFLADQPLPEAACMAVAGPTDGRQAQLTNLPWRIDTAQLSAASGIEHIRLINDFQAVAHGLDALGPDSLAPLQAGQPAAGAARLVLGAGTGLGVSLSIWNGARYQPIPGEGGHIAFAPMDAEQDALLKFLRDRYGRVSVERILSGQGIADLHRFACQQAGKPQQDAADPADITQAALDARDAQASDAMCLFCRIYGQTAGDLALVAGAQGGVYIAGGIAAKILPLITDGGFMAGFRDKGRFQAWMQTVPVSVVLDADVGLKGAALAVMAR